MKTITLLSIITVLTINTANAAPKTRQEAIQETNEKWDLKERKTALKDRQALELKQFKRQQKIKQLDLELKLTEVKK